MAEAGGWFVLRCGGVVGYMPMPLSVSFPPVFLRARSARLWTCQRPGNEKCEPHVLHWCSCTCHVRPISLRPSVLLVRTASLWLLIVALCASYTLARVRTYVHTHTHALSLSLSLSLASHVCSSCPRSVHGLQYEDCWRIRWMSSMTWWRLASSTLVR